MPAQVKRSPRKRLPKAPTVTKSCRRLLPTLRTTGSVRELLRQMKSVLRHLNSSVTESATSGHPGFLTCLPIPFGTGGAPF